MLVTDAAEQAGHDSDQGNFFERPWSHSLLVPSGFDHVSVSVTFFGDDNDFLWVEIWDGETRIGQVRAQGQFDPAKRLDADVVRAKTYELRIWTDKCCTKYEGLITQQRR